MTQPKKVNYPNNKDILKQIHSANDILLCAG